MVPKIEEIHDDIETVPKAEKIAPKNPFSVGQKKKTIKRDASEIYPEKKGLNKPQFSRNKPLDVLFSRVESILDGPLAELSIDVLFNRLSGTVKIEDNSEYGKSYSVVKQLTDLLLEIQECSIAEESRANDSSLITISLHDIKTFSKLVSVLIVVGIYPALTKFKLGIPIEKRRLKDFGKEVNRPLKIKEVVMTLDQCFNLMVLIHSQLLQVFSTSSDVKELMMRGTGISDFIVLSMALCCIPEFADKKPGFLYNQIQSIPDTFELFQTYNLLLSSPSPPYFRSFVLDHLQKLPYDAPRKDGVLTLVEFILGLRDQEEIQVEKFEHVALIILLKPKSIPTVQYFTSIGNQIYDQLIDINKPAITSCLVFVVEKLWERNKLVTQDFILKRIWHMFNPETPNEDENIDGVLVTEVQLNNNINVLISLTLKSVSDDLLITLFKPILIPLWSYITFLKSKKKPFEVAQGLLVSYFAVLAGNDSKQDIQDLDLISKNLVSQGGQDWAYEIGPNSLTQIVKKTEKASFESNDKRVNDFLNNLESCCKYYVELLDNLDDTQVSGVFTAILKRWLTTKPTTLNEENPFFVLIELRLLESIGQKFKDAIAKSPAEMLQLVYNFLLADHDKLQVYDTQDTEMDSDDEDDDMDVDNDTINDSNILTVVLELLSAILTESLVELDDDGMKLLGQIGQQLELKSGATGITQRTKESILALSERIKELQSQDSKPKDEEELQKRIFKRAIVSLNDPLVPIRAHGLYLLRQLIEQRSSVLTLDFVINLHLVQLKDLEPFVYLNVIKGLMSLIEWNAQQVLPKLTQLYALEENDLEERLKIGEVLLNFIQTSNELFGGESAQLIVEATLAIISRNKDKDKDSDDRLRMSAMSLMGVCCKTNPLGIANHLTDALDCSFGILQLEKSSGSAIMRRAAVVLIHDLILGTSNTDQIVFPAAYREKTLVVLRYITQTDNDLLVREQAQTVLDTIDELTRGAFELLQENHEQGKIQEI